MCIRDRESIGEVLKLLSDTSVSRHKKKELLINLKGKFTADENVFTINFDDLYQSLEFVLKFDKSNNKLPELSIQVLELLNSLLDSNSLQAEIFLTKFMSALMPSLATRNSVLSKNIISYVLKYLEKTSNYEAVFTCVNRVGVKASEGRLKVAALEAVGKWWTAIVNPEEMLGNLTAAHKLIQGAIHLLKNPSTTTKKAAQSFLLDIAKKSPKAVAALLRKVSSSSTMGYRKMLALNHVEVPENEELPVVSNKFAVVLTEKVVTRVIIEKNQKNDCMILPEINNLAFGTIPKAVIKKLEASSDPKERADGIEELKSVIISEKFPLFKPHFSAFLRYAVELLEDQNHKVCIGILQIICKLFC
eukprot:TRINITY_DN14581_c0_g3_i1.p1 TRINITY_DN14581_c0_g3~~TRINITY_DN14581_c0_g3_i1.p1  ORF type:complete len:361 (-),score=37.33 TRINITY_DN14581_c0_g3_i1:768-1850(-)